MLPSSSDVFMFLHIVMFACTGLQDDIKQTYRVDPVWISGAVAAATSHIRATAIFVLLSVMINCDINGWGFPR
jgi:hypothetical protein